MLLVSTPVSRQQLCGFTWSVTCSESTTEVLQVFLSRCALRSESGRVGSMEAQGDKGNQAVTAEDY